MKRGEIKPHIGRTPTPQKEPYACRGPGFFGVAVGNTPAEAYANYRLCCEYFVRDHLGPNP